MKMKWSNLYNEDEMVEQNLNTLLKFLCRVNFSYIAIINRFVKCNTYRTKVFNNYVGCKILIYTTRLGFTQSRKLKKKESGNFHNE